MNGEKMKIQTRYHGEVEINPEKIITFQKGIPSFEDEKKIYSLELGEETIFLVLQSVRPQLLHFL